MYAPFTTPAYSNAASAILAFVVEAAAAAGGGNTSYADFVGEQILAPLGMSNTTIHRGPAQDAWGFIPLGEDWWGASLGHEDAAGGFYSNTRDLQAFGAGILRHEVLGGAATRRWLKPAAATSSSGLVMGAPWEILRSTTATADGRLVEFFCKAGNLHTYNNMLCLVPDYDLVLTILSGGAESSGRLVDGVLSTVVKGLLPAIEDAGKSQARKQVAGTYHDAASNSSVTLAVDEDGGPGLKVAKWVVRGVDVIENYAGFGALSSSPTRDVEVSVRLYPTNLEAATAAESGGRGGNKAAWRAVFDVGSADEIAEYEASMFWPNAGCATWGKMDRFVYQFRSIDEFVITVDEEGCAEGLRLHGFQVDLERES